MPPLVTLELLIRDVPPHRLVTGNRSLRLPSALCLMGRLRWVPLRHAMQASHDAGAVFISHAPHEGSAGRKPDAARE